MKKKILYCLITIFSLSVFSFYLKAEKKEGKIRCKLQLIKEIKKDKNDLVTYNPYLIKI